MKKIFDCVEFKHALQERAQNEIKGMTRQQIHEQLKKAISEGLLSDYCNRLKAKSTRQQNLGS